MKMGDATALKVIAQLGPDMSRVKKSALLICLLAGQVSGHEHFHAQGALGRI